MKLTNRFVRSATYEGMAAGDGICTPALREKMVELAAGGVGLIITSHSFVSPEGRARPLQLGIHSDAMIPALRTMTDAVHARDSRIVIQLAHAGAQADPKMTGLAALDPRLWKRRTGLSPVRWSPPISPGPRRPSERRRGVRRRPDSTAPRSTRHTDTC